MLAQERIKGGVQVLDDHARNPLWAFVKYRLHARQLTDYAEPGESNARGIFLHGVMEQLWQAVQTQDRLHELTEQGSLGSVVRRCADAVAQSALADYGERLRQLEVERACIVVEHWLEVEKKRPPFSVYALEPRPVDLQLPLYAAVLQQEHEQSKGQTVAALVLAKLHARGNEARGLADIDCFPGVAAVDKWIWPESAEKTWDQVLLDWRQAISTLADEFISGVAQNRVWSEQDLQYCDVKPFLRRFEGGM